jgi:hypothetical protein
MSVKNFKWSLNIPNVCTIFQMAIKYINIFQSKALQNLPKLVLLVLERNHLATLVASVFAAVGLQGKPVKANSKRQESQRSVYTLKSMRDARCDFDRFYEPTFCRYEKI